MNVGSKTAITACLILFMRPATGQQTSSASVEPFQASLATLTGPNNSSLDDIKLEGKVEYFAGSTHEFGTVKLKAAKGGFSEVLLKVPSGVHRETRTRSSQMRVGRDADSSNVRVTSFQNLLVEPYWFAPELFLEALSHKDEWSSAGSADDSQQDKKSLHIKLQRSIKSKPGPSQGERKLCSTDLLVDKQTMRPTSIAYAVYPDSVRYSPTRMWFKYDDYRDVNGHLVPFHIQQYKNAVLNLDIHIDTALVNQKLKSTDFSLQGEAEHE